ncbi:hypothetical protein [Promicromonospora soli]|uniref:LPXTG-motif cell wall-anchored protein n=1 Tax=Promicromonospora soli TaxID=2035533 RepID=A0A919G255_9MICO|nr:hypothetical protein [Promicromonospora soli]GHH76506.1 hypothetical protein GCM10017772_35330 [Promicromonospora soli]
MLRRLISAMVVTAAAVMAPAAAAAADDGYGPGEPPCILTFTAQTVTAGEDFGYTITCEGLPGATVTVQATSEGQTGTVDQEVEVAGTSADTFTLDEEGIVYVDATISAPGDFTFQAFGTDGDPLSEVFTITAVAAGADDDDDGGLAVTGSTSLPYLVIAGGLLALGLGAIVTTRIRVRRS